jgi:hypothetical protein
VKINLGFQSTSSPQTQNPIYPLYPSVQQLLHEKGIPDSEISKIPATGPKGRLLKGDVLAYLGSIAADYPSTQAAQIAKLSHLDLSNIKLAAVAAKPSAPTPAVEEAVPAAPVETSVAVPISLASVLSVQKRIQDTLGVTVPLSAFIARAADLANDDLPRSPLSKPTVDELFDEILGAEPIQTSRGDYIPDINSVPLEEVITSSPSVKQPVEEEEDIIDFLSGNVSKRAPVAAAPPVTPDPASAGGAVNVFSVTVPVEEERRAKAFLERIRTILTIEPGRLVL